MQEKLKELNKYEYMEKDKELMLTLSHELFTCKPPSPSYPIFLFEHMTLFQIKDLKEGSTSQVVTPSQFLETLTQSEFVCTKLLCELYLHDKTYLMDTKANPFPYIGDIILRSFTSFVLNHVCQLRPSQTIRRNEENFTLWIRGEPRAPYPFDFQAQEIPFISI